MSESHTPEDVKPGSLVRPYYEDDFVRLYHGDCRESFPLLADESVGCVITDPPYSQRTHEAARATVDGTVQRSLSGGSVRQFPPIDEAELAAILTELGRVSRGWVVATLDYAHAARFDVEPPAGLKVQRLGVWVKTNPTPQISGDRPAQGWESIAYMHRNDRRSKWNGGGSHGNFVTPIPPPEGHPTAKPLGMVAQWVRWFSQPGETVLDPFAASGTTLRAAKNEGRHAVGWELEERYCEIAAKRLSQDVLFGGAA